MQRTARMFLAATVLALPLAATALALAPTAGDEVPKPIAIGDTVPETLALPDLDGVRVSMKDLRGKVVMIHFWSGTCPYEKHANPVFRDLEQKYAENKDVVLLGINSNATELGERPGEGADWSKFHADIRKWVAAEKFTHSMLVDHGNVVADLFDAKSTPHCYVIDKKGVLQYAGALDDDPSGKKGDEATIYFADATDAVLAGKQPETPTTKAYGCSIKRVSKP